MVLRYVDNPNGSVDDIAGVCSAGRNVVGLMPHPERASDPLLGSEDGAVLLRGTAAHRRRGGARGRAGRTADRSPVGVTWSGPGGAARAQLRERGILACCSTEALTPTVRHAE